MAGSDALDGPVLRLTKYAPTVPPVPPGGWDKCSLPIFKGFQASTGHRGRVDARGHRGHLPSGLTRTTRHVPALFVLMDAGAAPAAAALARERARRMRHARAGHAARAAPPSLTTRSAGTVKRVSRQARHPAGTMAAGIGAASMVRRCLKSSQKWKGPHLSQPPGRTSGTVGAYLVRRRTGPSRASTPATRGSERGMEKARGRTFTERPRK